MAGSGRKILVVDDDPWIAKMLEFVASDAGHTAVVCKDGNDAIEKFAEVMPDLVLLDVVLPKLDGLKVCEHIKKSPIGRLTPVLVFSGIYRDSTEALKFGADAFLAKPFTPRARPGRAPGGRRWPPSRSRKRWGGWRGPRAPASSPCARGSGSSTSSSRRATSSRSARRRRRRASPPRFWPAAR